MNKKEKEALKNEIGYKNVMTKRIGGWARKAFVVCLIMCAVAYWGFSGLEDSFLSVPDVVRDVAKWIALVVAIVSGIFAIMSFLSFRNSKKHVLALIETLHKN
ncbi:hypothetical protein A4S06_07360 [Erysipelotrichaceae bacterium MTC7]|nr:hypothetical protein A4S06_07360 [Erysipelotrichaceae bacterium MTC7]